MERDLTILYRGPLSSCNYDCWYCPFAKHHETARELTDDRSKLLRFQRWVANKRDTRFSIQMIPWGEALIRTWYREAFVELSQLPNVAKIAAQTNLSFDLGWLDQCEKSKVGLWCTYHPSQIDRHSFVEKCRELELMRIPHSAGVVGLKENIDEIIKLRDELPRATYLWINAYKDVSGYYTEQEVDTLAAIDPQFTINNHRHMSFGRDCHTGESVISVDGNGDFYRCFFVRKKLGNIYKPDFENELKPRVCTKATCGCHIGYVHMHDLQLYPSYGAGLLERRLAVPVQIENSTR